jgi:hypothetical protein
VLTTRRLSLSRETLTELTKDDLSVVHAASADCTTILTFLTCRFTCATEV